MNLRTYQQAAVDAILRDWRTFSDLLLVAATGAGKTNMFLRLVMDILDADPTARALVLAHRQELIEQPLDRIRHMDEAWLMRDAQFTPRVGVVMAEHNDADRQLTIATIQSLASEKRLTTLLSHGPITHLITDEAHHCVAPSYLKVYEALKSAHPALKHLGVTATPMRADGDGLAKVYQHVAAQITIADLVKLGYLVHPRWLGISTGISIAGVKSSGGDFVPSQLARMFDTATGRQVVVQAYQQYAQTNDGTWRRAIAFTASVAGARDLADAFTRAGITAACVSGETPKDERRRILDAFRRGEIQVMVNCQVLTEGFDAPGTSCILMCRPTRSDSAYIQCMGRGLRPALGLAQPGEDCLILDFLPVETRNIVMAGDVLGLPKAVTRAAIADEADAEAGAVQAGFTFDGEHFDSSGTPLDIVARQLDYLQTTPFCWDRRDGWLVLGLGKAGDERERILAISPPRADQAQRLYGLIREPGSYTWRHMLLLEASEVERLLERAEVVIERYASGILVEKNRSWQTQPISDGQKTLLRRLSRGEVKQMERLSKGDAARLINFYMARHTLQAAGAWL